MNRLPSCILLILIACCCACAGEETAKDFHQQGLKHLTKAMEGENSELLPAARWFTKAVVAFDEEGNDEMAQEAQACLYWSKKRMGEKEIEAFVKGMPDKFRKVAELEVDEKEAESYMQRAVDFADKNPKEHLLIAIRYFEIADRFKNTDYATIALEKSLTAMRQVQSMPDFCPRKSEIIATIVNQALDDAWTEYANEVGEAKKEYVENLDRSLEYEMKKGNLEEAKGITQEKKFILDGDNTYTSNEISSKYAQRHQKTYMRKVERADQSYIRALEKEVREETKAGHLDAATRIKMEIVIFENPGGKLWNGHYYNVIRKHCTWHEAQKEAAKIGGHLVTITSFEEQEFLDTLLKPIAQGGRISFWADGSDERQEGKWEWSTGEEWTFSLWYHKWNEPNGGRKENCFCITYLHGINGRWVDLGGQGKWEKCAFYPVVEWDGFESTAAKEHSSDTSSNSNNSKLDNLPEILQLAIKRSPKFNILNLSSIPLEEVNNPEKVQWARVPELFKKHKAVIYSREGRNGSNGVLDIEIEKDGVLIVACNYSYQGNSSGGWQKERWTAQQFQNNGWTQINNEDLGGQLIQGNGKDFVLFAKKVEKGEKYRLRCNKYQPPYPIVFE